MRKRETMTKIRITTPGGFWAPLDPTVADGCLSVRLAENFAINAQQITNKGNAIVDLGTDYGMTAIPADDFEIVEHRTMLVIDNGKKHVECDCGWTQAENKNHPEPIAALRKSGATHERYMEAIS